MGNLQDTEIRLYISVLESCLLWDNTNRILRIWRIQSKRHLVFWLSWCHNPVNLVFSSCTWHQSLISLSIVFGNRCRTLLQDKPYLWKKVISMVPAWDRHAYLHHITYLYVVVIFQLTVTSTHHFRQFIWFWRTTCKCNAISLPFLFLLFSKKGSVDKEKGWELRRNKGILLALCHSFL